jgi:dTDP-4-dehydrorhamnose reductase
MQGIYYTANVRELDRLRTIAQAQSPAVVFHAAAYKHVPLMEELNEIEAVQTNVLGTLNMALVAGECGARRFVLVSTDKAVNPTNVMGASKRLAEQVVQGVAALHPQTQYVSVRFGNVLGSSGSVVPLFTRQIARGGPVTVTHPEIVRYFMTISEAAQLVLQAGLMGESGQIFVLDMGEPVKIIELARMLIRLSRSPACGPGKNCSRNCWRTTRPALRPDIRSCGWPGPPVRCRRSTRCGAGWRRPGPRRRPATCVPGCAPWFPNTARRVDRQAGRQLAMPVRASTSLTSSSRTSGLSSSINRCLSCTGSGSSSHQRFATQPQSSSR